MFCTDWRGCIGANKAEGKKSFFSYLCHLTPTILLDNYVCRDSCQMIWLHSLQLHATNAM